MSDVLRHVCASIGPASVAHGEAARARVSGAGTPILERLAFALGGAQHTPRPRSERRIVIVAAGDHGCGDPGIAMGADHPTVVAARAIAAGTAALCDVARSTRTPILVIDAGTCEALPASVVTVRHGPSGDLTRGPAMTANDAVLGLEAGIALAVSVTETRDTRSEIPLLVLALGAIGVGAEVASAAILGAATGISPNGLGDAIAEAAGARGAAMARASGIELLAAFGGGETAVLAGLILGAASMNVPVILDGHATGAAALIAAAIMPHVTGYLVAAHRGSFTQPQIVAHLGLTPVFDVGLGHGEGTGAAMVLPLVDQVASLVS